MPKLRDMTQATCPKQELRPRLGIRLRVPKQERMHKISLQASASQGPPKSNSLLYDLQVRILPHVLICCYVKSEVEKQKQDKLRSLQFFRTLDKNTNHVHIAKHTDKHGDGARSSRKARTGGPRVS
jgi:hypothetical protein